MTSLLNDEKCVKMLAVYARFCTQAYGDLFSGVVLKMKPRRIALKSIIKCFKEVNIIIQVTGFIRLIFPHR